jgi:hypothetical protein
MFCSSIIDALSKHSHSSELMVMHAPPAIYRAPSSHCAQYPLERLRMELLSCVGAAFVHVKQRVVSC